jgi:predicted SPOUT superfamily RNA methylase MTH1
VGEFREGVVVSSSKNKSLIDIGVENPVSINTKFRVNTRVTLRITEIGKKPRVLLAKKKEIDKYWGYRVTFSKASLGRLVKNDSFDLVIATSRKGTSVTKILDKLIQLWKSSNKTLLVFGSPTQGLHDIVANEGIELDDIAHFVINTVPRQGTETVRTEEAIASTLSIVNVFVNDLQQEP